jgi:hypothetical protein
MADRDIMRVKLYFSVFSNAPDPMRFTPLMLFVVCLSFVATAQTTGTVAEQMTELAPLIIQFHADEGSLLRFYIIQQSPERRQRLVAFYNDYATRLKALPFDEMSVGGKADYLLFQRALQNELFQLSEEEREYTSVEKLINYADPIYALEKERRRGKHLESAAIAGRLNDVLIDIKQRTKNINRADDLSRSEARRAGAIVEGHREALKSVFEFYNHYDPDFTWWVTQPYHKLDTALLQYGELLRNKVNKLGLPKDDGSGIIGYPIGAKELTRLLEMEMIPYSAEELIDIANKEFAWCDRELLKASQEMGFGSEWKKAQEKVKQSYVAPGRQPEAMLDLYNQSVDFLKKHDLISIPTIAEESWRMEMLSAKDQLISPFFLGGEVLQISYPTDAMSQTDKMMSMRGNNPHFSRATVHHELIAGHHLQGYMMNRYKSYRNYYTPFWMEGWAL